MSQLSGITTLKFDAQQNVLSWCCAVVRACVRPVPFQGLASRIQFDPVTMLQEKHAANNRLH